MRFKDIAGHNRIKEIFIKSFNENKIGHAYIFEGIKGVGKQSAALAFAAMALCENNKSGELFDSCGECKSCAMINAGSHPDVRIVTNELYEIERSSGIIAVDTIREMKSEVYTKSFMGGRKFFIVPNADMMNINAQNALLKVFEEPPQGTTVILLCENENKFLQTIRSRAVEIKFNPISSELIKEYLSNSECDKSLINFAVDSSGGSIGYAKELLENEEFSVTQNLVSDYILGMINADYTKKYGFILYLKKNKDSIDFILSYLLSVLRDMLNSKLKKQAINSGYGENICRIYERISVGEVLRLTDICLKYSDLILKNVNYKVAVQCMVLEIWEIING